MLSHRDSRSGSERASGSARRRPSRTSNGLWKSIKRAKPTNCCQFPAKKPSRCRVTSWTTTTAPRGPWASASRMYFLRHWMDLSLVRTRTAQSWYLVGGTRAGPTSCRCATCCRGISANAVTRNAFHIYRCVRLAWRSVGLRRNASDAHIGSVNGRNNDVGLMAGRVEEGSHSQAFAEAESTNRGIPSKSSLQISDKPLLLPQDIVGVSRIRMLLLLLRLVLLIVQALLLLLLLRLLREVV